MLLKDKKVAVIGGGPGGLMLARLLQVKGADVKVYERDADAHARVQGATLDLHGESGLEALRRGGLIDAFYEKYRPDAGKLRVLDDRARIRLDDHAPDDAPADRPEIDRGPLRGILLESLEPGTVVWGSRFDFMEKEAAGRRLYFKNGTSAYADIVISADGARSKVRSYVTDIRPVYSGVTIVEGHIHHPEKHAPRLDALLKGGKIFAFGGQKSLILSAKGDGSLTFYTGCKVDEGWMRDAGIDFADCRQVSAWFNDAFGDWDGVWRELFADGALVCMPRPQYYYPTDQDWETQPDLTLLGDAAHLMPPYAGEGVNMAMQDAYELAECLTGKDFEDIRTALAAYEKQMRKRAAEVTRITLDSTEMLHSEDAIPRMMELVGKE